jgi:hypothetical protein
MHHGWCDNRPHGAASKRSLTEKSRHLRAFLSLMRCGKPGRQQPLPARLFASQAATVAPGSRAIEEKVSPRTQPLQGGRIDVEYHAALASRRGGVNPPSSRSASAANVSVERSSR